MISGLGGFRRITIYLFAFIAVAMGGAGCAPPPDSIDPNAPHIICLLYHRFVTPQAYARLHGKERVYSIPVDRFEQQLKYLRDAGYRSMTAEEVVAVARGELPLSSRAALLTIDDGCRSAKTLAEPLLKKYGFRAVLFLTTDPKAGVFNPARADQTRLSDEELRGLDPAVWEVHAHGVTHRSLRAMPDDELLAELRRSRASIERTVGRPVRYMAVPGNWYDKRVLRFAGQAGYEAVFVSDRGIVTPGSDSMHLPRINIAGYFNRRAFQALIDPRRYDGSPR